jgi:hypothetical protein
MTATSAEVTLADVVEELRAIRTLLEQQGICPHGNSGVCMYCIQPTLDQLSSDISATVFEVRKR